MSDGAKTERFTIEYRFMIKGRIITYLKRIGVTDADGGDIETAQRMASHILKTDARFTDPYNDCSKETIYSILVQRQ